ncbi:MAG: class I SAM-dependent methyltransferase [Armatimonadota bacterium]
MQTTTGVLGRGWFTSEKLAQGYWTTVNTDMLREIPLDAKRVLDVGCGSGGTGAALKRRQNTEVHGIELDEAAAAKAGTRLDGVWCGDAEKLELAVPDGYFDCIVYGDILEHLAWPGDLLRKHRRLLAPSGRVVITIPNVQYVGVIVKLALGRWQYAASGILDSTHLRFFTLRTAVEMLASAGYTVVAARPSYGRRWFSMVDVCTAGCFRGLLAYKYTLVAQPTTDGGR